MGNVSNMVVYRGYSYLLNLHRTSPFRVCSATTETNLDIVACQKQQQSWTERRGNAPYQNQASYPSVVMAYNYSWWIDPTTPNWGSGQYPGEWGCCSGRLQKAGEMSLRGPHEVQKGKYKRLQRATKIYADIDLICRCPKTLDKQLLGPCRLTFEDSRECAMDFKSMPCDWQALHLNRQILYRNVEGLLPLFPANREHTDDGSRIVIQQCIPITAFQKENASTFQQHLKYSLLHSQSSCQSPLLEMAPSPRRPNPRS